MVGLQSKTKRPGVFGGGGTLSGQTGGGGGGGRGGGWGLGGGRKLGKLRERRSGKETPDKVAGGSTERGDRVPAWGEGDCLPLKS